MTSQATELAARPSLGTLRFSNGMVVELDRPAVIGRNPQLVGHLGGEIPVLVTLDPAPAGVSRRHVGVRIDGWNVLVEDLGSANGTTLIVPHGLPTRLPANVPVAFERGFVLDLGGEMTMTFE